MMRFIFETNLKFLTKLNKNFKHEIDLLRLLSWIDFKKSSDHFRLDQIQDGSRLSSTYRPTVYIGVSVNSMTSLTHGLKNNDVSIIRICSS